MEAQNCPISLQTMTDPYMTPTGHSYQREFIYEWVVNHGSDPATREKITIEDLKPNLTLRDLIRQIAEHQEVVEPKRKPKKEVEKKPKVEKKQKAKKEPKLKKEKLKKEPKVSKKKQEEINKFIHQATCDFMSDMDFNRVFTPEVIVIE